MEDDYVEFDDDYGMYLCQAGYKEQEDALEWLREMQENIDRHKEYERIANILGRN